MDQGIKRLLQTHPRDILALAVPDAEYLGTRPVDVATEPQLLLDSLLRVRYRGEECLIDLEAEARPKPDIPRRLYAYGTRTNVITALPVLSVVLWLERGGAVPTSPYVLRVANEVLATWHFIGIEVYKLRAEDLIARGLLGLLPLTPFTSGGDNFQMFERVAELVKDRAPSEDVVELEMLLGVFGARHFGDAPVLSTIRRILMSTEIIGTSPLYQYWVREATEESLAKGLAEGLEKGLMKGLEEGKAEGEAKGKAEGLREAVLAMLRGRFGELAPDLSQALAAAGVEALEGLLPHLATESLDAIRTRLGV